MSNFSCIVFFPILIFYNIYTHIRNNIFYIKINNNLFKEKKERMISSQKKKCKEEKKVIHLPLEKKMTFWVVISGERIACVLLETLPGLRHDYLCIFLLNQAYFKYLCIFLANQAYFRSFLKKHDPLKKNKKNISFAFIRSFLKIAAFH